MFDSSTLVAMLEGGANVSYSSINGKQFAKYASVNRDRMVKLSAWSLGAEDGLPVRKGKPWNVGFQDWGKPTQEGAPLGELDIPFEFLSQLGYHNGSRIDRVILFAEYVDSDNLKFYFAERKPRQISRREWEKICAGIDRILG